MATTSLTCPHCGAPDAPAKPAQPCPACGRPRAARAAAPIPVVEEVGVDAWEDDGPPIKRNAPKADESEMDMTPMVDVTFLLLIFFIMTAAFSLQKSIEIPPTPEQTQSSTQVLEEDQDTVTVRVDADNVFWVSNPAEDKEEEAPSEAELLSQLRAARNARGPGQGPTKMLVMASGDARHEFVVKALDAGTAVGMEEVKLATMDDDE